MGRHLSPRYGQVILVSGYPVLTAVNWSQHWCAICVQYQSSCVPKLARKCEIEHWLACGADGRSLGRPRGWSVYGHGLTKFSRMGSLLNFLTQSAPLRELREGGPLSVYLFLATTATVGTMCTWRSLSTNRNHRLYVCKDLFYSQPHIFCNHPLSSCSSTSPSTLSIHSNRLCQCA